MLGKLFKHEMRALTKVLLPVNVLLLLITGIGSLTLRSFNFNPENSNAVSQMLLTLFITSYFVSLVCVTCGAFIYMFVRYYKTMYSDEGYLTNTLPLGTHTLIIGKTLASSLWLFITYSVTFLSVILLVYGQLNSATRGEIYVEFLNLIEEYNRYAPVSFGPLMILALLIYLASMVYSVLFMFASMAIGQLFHKHKIIGSIVAYFGLNMVVQIISTIAMVFSGMFGYMSADGSFATPDSIISYFYSAYAINGIIVVVLGAACYYISYVLTKKKLNLD